MRATGRVEGQERWRRWTARGGWVVAGAPLLAFLLLAPTSLAGAVPATVLSAPYHHLGVKKSDPSSVSSCGGASLVHRAVFNATTGVGGFSDAGNVSVCSGASSTNVVTEEGNLVLSVPFHVKTNGTYNLSVFWLTVATGSVNVTSGSCTGTSAGGSYPNCNVSAAAFVYGTAYILDKTTGKHLKLSNAWPGNSTYVWNYTYCYPSPIGCHSTKSKALSATLHTGSAYWAWYWNSTALVAGNSYALKLNVYGGVKVTATSAAGAKLTGASANAQLNSATLGNEEELYSVTVP